MPATPDRQPAMLAIGGLHVDEVATLQSDYVQKASNPVSWQRYAGGVASNAARAAHRHYSLVGQGRVTLHAALGCDGQGKLLKAAMCSQGIAMDVQWADEQPTDRYCALITCSGELLMGLADITLAEKLNVTKAVATLHASNASHVLLDANLSGECLEALIHAASDACMCVTALTVSPKKAVRLLAFAQRISVLFCNRREALALAIASGLLAENTQASQVDLPELAYALTAAGFSDFVLTDGDAGLLISCHGRHSRHTVPQIPITHNVNGAGDTLAGTSMAAITLGIALDKAVVDYGIPSATDIITGKNLPLTL